MWRDVSGTVGGGGSNGRWTVVSSDNHINISKDIFQSAAEEFRELVVDSDGAENLPLAMSSLDHTLLALDNNGHWDEFIFGQGIAVLLSFSLMKRDESSEMLSVHSLVHQENMMVLNGT